MQDSYVSRVDMLNAMRSYLIKQEQTKFKKWRFLDIVQSDADDLKELAIEINLLRSLRRKIEELIKMKNNFEVLEILKNKLVNVWAVAQHDKLSSYNEFREERALTVVEWCILKEWLKDE